MKISVNQLKVLVPTVAVITLAVGVSGCSNSTATPRDVYKYKDAPKPGLIAKVGDVEITEDQVIKSEPMTYYNLKKQDYEFKANQADEIIRETLINEAAKKASLSPEEYMAKKVMTKDGAVSDKDIDAFLKEQNFPKEKLTDELKPRVIEAIKEQRKEGVVEAHVAKLAKSAGVEFYLKRPSADIAVNLDGSPIWGDKDAKVTIVEFSDFQCPYCSRAAATIDEVKAKYKGKVKIAFKHFPLPFHREAGPASEAAMCINEQSVDKFWKYHDILFKNQMKLAEENLKDYAKQAGADMKKFEECYTGKKFAEFIKKDMKDGEKAGIRSTPTFLINGEPVQGALPFKKFAEVIDAQLQASK